MLFTSGDQKTPSATRPRNRWCVFTSAGDHNAIRLWLRGKSPRRWDLVVAYYGTDSAKYANIQKSASYAFRIEGGKFQNLKKFFVQKPQFFDQYSHVWVCDDDIQMSAKQIDEAFAIAEFYDFWIAQPAFLPEEKTHTPFRSTIQVATTGSSTLLNAAHRSFVAIN